jgi:hypothetical protein
MTIKKKTSKKASSTSGLIGAARAKKSRASSTEKTPSQTQAAKKPRKSSVLSVLAGESLAQSVPRTTERGGSSAGSLKGALAKKRTRTSRDSYSPSGIAPQDCVACTWTVDRAFGSSDGRFEGVVQQVRQGKEGDFITVLNRDDVLLDVYTNASNMTVKVK